MMFLTLRITFDPQGITTCNRDRGEIVKLVFEQIAQRGPKDKFQKTSSTAGVQGSFILNMVAQIIIHMQVRCGRTFRSGNIFCKKNIWALSFEDVAEQMSCIHAKSQPLAHEYQIVSP